MFSDPGIQRWTRALSMNQSVRRLPSLYPYHTPFAKHRECEEKHGSWGHCLRMRKQSIYHRGAAQWLAEAHKGSNYRQHNLAHVITLSGYDAYRIPSTKRDAREVLASRWSELHVPSCL